MAKLEKLTVGQKLWTVRRGKMGNTTISTIHVLTAKVLAVSPEGAMISWNGNSPRLVREKGLAEYKTTEPCTVKTWNGSGARMATKDERKSILAERKAKQEARNDSATTN